MKIGLLLAAVLLLGANPAELNGAPTSSVTGFRLDPGASGPELTIEMTGDVRFTDFSFADPARVVIDIRGAREILPISTYDVRRGGVSGIRASQYSDDIVRIIIELDRSVDYEVAATEKGINIRLASGLLVFQPWSTTGSGPTTSVAPPAPAQAMVSLAAAVDMPNQTISAALQEQPRITVTFQGADIRDVLASFAEFTGRSIVPGAGVDGIVTATIRDQPWDVALQTILRAYGLAAQELPSGIIQVDSVERLQERQILEPLVTETFRINYVPAAELAGSLDGLLSERGRIATNPSTNTLILTDVVRVLDNVRSMLSQLDVRTPQVSIQAKIIFVNRTDVEELGISYDLKDREGSSLNRLAPGQRPGADALADADYIHLGGSSIAALGNANIRVQQPQLEAVLSLVMGRFTLVSFIDALQSQELSDVQAAPLITTLDNQEAEIWVGERTPIRVVDIGTAGATGPGVSAPRATAELVETGIRLRVTPHITADRRILMQLHAERSSAQLAATDIGVVFQQQQGTTRLMVEDGETAVIGGLTVTELVSTTAGIPLLMDIPVIGSLFRTTRNREQKRDLLIMVTPRIVDDYR